MTDPKYKYDMEDLKDKLNNFDPESALDEIKSDFECAEQSETRSDFTANLKEARLSLLAMVNDVDTLIEQSIRPGKEK